MRELQNSIHSLVITKNTAHILRRDLPPHILGSHEVEYSEDIMTGQRPLRDIVAELERDFLLKALEVHGSVQKVAALFRINRSTVFRKIQKKHSTKSA